MDAEAAAPASQGASCPNCATPVLGDYCHACGQDQRALPTLRAFVAEGLDDLFSADGRLWRTLRPLLLRPGQLSRAYLDGKRIRYVPPLRLYLSVSVLYFGAFVLLDARYFMGMRLEGFAALLSRLMILVVPGFALLLHLLFGRKRHAYVEDLVVALHYHGFAFVLLSVHLLFDSYLGTSPPAVVAAPLLVLDVALQVWVIVVLFRLLRDVYGRSWGSTVARGLVLLAGYVVTILASALAVYYLGRILPALGGG